MPHCFDGYQSKRRANEHCQRLKKIDDACGLKQHYGLTTSQSLTKKTYFPQRRTKSQVSLSSFQDARNSIAVQYYTCNKETMPTIEDYTAAQYQASWPCGFLRYLGIGANSPVDWGVTQIHLPNLERYGLIYSILNKPLTKNVKAQLRRNQQ